VTDDQHGEGTPQAPGRWDPLPQGDYDDGATAFVKLPEGGIDALLAGDSPLAAPGHGYVPPQITVAPATTAGTDPAATGTWAMPAAPVEGDGWPAPATGGTVGDDRFTYQPAATGQWTFGDANAPQAPAQEPAPAPGHEVTGQWSIPVAGGDLPDESGEYTTSSLVEQWGGTPPATLPGGAPAPWATPQEPDRTWGGHQVPGTGAYGDPGAPVTEPYPAAPSPGAVEGVSEGSGAPGAVLGADAAVEAVEGVSGASAEASADAVGSAETDVAAEARIEPEAAPAPATADTPTADTDVPDVPDAPAPAPEVPQDAHDLSEPQQTPEAEDASHAPDAPADLPPPPAEEHPLASYVLRVNGTDRPVTDAWIGESLLYVLRERLGLAGAKDGCSQGECGACNVQVDGRLVASCLVPAATAAGSEVRTVEGLAADGQPSDVQRALARCGAVQCGFCVPGMAMTVHDLLEGNPAPSELETRQALCGNLCRCSGYRGVLDAVQEVVAEREAHRAGAEHDGDQARIPHQAGPGAGGVNPSAFEAGGDPSAFDAGPPDQPYGHGHGPGPGQDGGQA
jgi:aerobic-type carbon monoxide dehydrogenase small subunit (CoxS/CutS family)